MNNQELAEAIQVAYEHAKGSLGCIQKDAVHHLKTLRKLQADRAMEYTHHSLCISQEDAFQEQCSRHGEILQKGGTGRCQ